MSGSKIKNYRWIVCVFLFAATTINYIDRQIFGLLKPELEKVFSWTEMDYSRIVMAFTACYALGQLIYGRIIDKTGTKMGYTISITLWSIAAMLHTVVKSTLGFGLVRGFLTNDPMFEIISPTLTTVEEPAKEIGRRSCELLMKHIFKKHFIAEEVILPTKLIIRESTQKQ